VLNAASLPFLFSLFFPPYSAHRGEPHVQHTLDGIELMGDILPAVLAILNPPRFGSRLFFFPFFFFFPFSFFFFPR